MLEQKEGLGMKPGILTSGPRGGRGPLNDGEGRWGGTYFEGKMERECFFKR